ncbi:phage tail sheath family protein [Paracoccus sp. KR1-242]|uniref:phage tail sheath family protein n=1 Tax=Paracoccus sp. KR1-242 TaxID=3410028 RepID=UPI003BFD1F8B
MPPVFGMTITAIDNEPRTPVWGDMSIIGLIGTAPDADEEQFPINTPVLIRSSDADALEALGAAGTLADAVKLINAQLGELQAAALVVVVRVTAGADTAATIANIVGNATDTGVGAFLQSGQLLGYTPRLLAAPGFTSQTATGVSALTIANAGSGYANGTFPLTATGGGGSGFAGTATVAGGVITAVNITSPGTGYTSAPTISLSALSGGTGGSVTAAVAPVGNAVVAALAGICNRLLAHAVVDGPGTSRAAAQAWRETISSDRIIPVEPAVKVTDATGVAVVVPLSPAVLGIAVRRDAEFAGRPFHSWANQAVQGIVGPSRPIGFSLTDDTSEGQLLLASNIGILTRGEMGVDGAIADGGFIFIGTDNAGSDELWRFYNVKRGRDYIHLMCLKTLRTYLGKFNITGQTIQAIVNTLNGALRDLKATGDILGYRVDFVPDQNSPENLRAGRITVGFQAEEAPVLRRIDVQSMRYRPALNALVDDLASA